MKLPRDLSGSEVARLLERHYGYRVARTKRSHMTLELTVGGRIHHVTVPRHADIRVGTLNAIIGDGGVDARVEARGGCASGDSGATNPPKPDGASGIQR